MSARHLSKVLAWRETYCGAIITPLDMLPTSNPDAVECPECLKIMAEAGFKEIPLTLTEYSKGVGTPTPLQKPPRMEDERGLTDGVFEFYDVHEGGDWALEVVPQTTGNVEITIGGTMFTLSHLDRANLLRALLHDFHYSPERGGPNDD